MDSENQISEEQKEDRRLKAYQDMADLQMKDII